MEEKIKALMAEEAFAEKLMACEEPEQVQALFAEKGVELSLDEVVAIGKGVSAALGEGDELDEDALDSVAGGSVASDVVNAIVGAVSTIAKNWRSIKNWFRRW